MSKAANEEWKDSLLVEIEKGGTAAPCPFCKVPRVKRSDYIRCCRCGVNWIAGENLSQDPRAERTSKFLDGVRATTRSKDGGKKTDGQE